MSYTLPGILRSTTIEPQSAESKNTNDGDVQSFPDQTLCVNRSTTRIETQSSESMNAKQSAVRCSNARILQLNDRPGPLLVHLNQIYSVIEDLLLCACPVYKQQKQKQSQNNTQIQLQNSPAEELSI